LIALGDVLIVPDEPAEVVAGEAIAGDVATAGGDGELGVGAVATTGGDARNGAIVTPAASCAMVCGADSPGATSRST